MEYILPETLKIVFGFLDPITVFRTVPRVCKKWNRVINDENLYREIYIENFGETLADSDNKIVSASSMNLNGKWKQLLTKTLTKLFSFKDDGPAIIYWAVREGYHQYVKKALDHSTIKWHLYSATSENLSALHVCAAKQDIRMLQILCNHLKYVLQVPIDFIRSKFGRTALHTATWVGSKNLVECILYYGASMYTKESLYGQYSLHIAAARGWVDLVALYLDKGMDINLQDQDLMTPLYLASLQGHLNVVKELLRRGADPTITSNGGPPANVARVKGYIEIHNLLVKAPQNRSNAME